MSAKGYRYAISDIHGCYNTFVHLLEQEIKLQYNDELYLLGDYIDRGPDSKKVIDHIMQLKEEGYQVHPLRGNHEDMLLNAFISERDNEFWINFGGNTTLESFGVEDVTELPEKYVDFFRQLDFFVKLDDYLLVHAGFNFEVIDPFKDVHAMMWVRNFEPNKLFTGNRTIVHGHTPTPIIDIWQSLQADPLLVVSIDAGCAHIHKEEMGFLAALNLDTLQLHSVENMDSK